MTERTITAVTAGLSQPSSTRLLANRLADATREALQERGVDSDVTVLELRELAVDIAKCLVTKVPSAALQDAIDVTTRADGLIAVTPVFTASYSGLFKSFFDVVGSDDLIGMPVLLGATGGTERHSLVPDQEMRPMFAYLRAVPSPTAVYAASSDWGSGEEAAGKLRERIARAASEFAALASGGVVERRRPDADPEPVPFDQLLGSLGRSGEAS